MATTHNIGIRLSLDATSVTRQAPEAGQRLQAIGNQAQQGAAQATQALARVQMSVADLAKGAIGLGAIGAALQGISAGITALPRNAFNYAKDLEASQLGMAGILSSMTAINGKQLQLHAALQLSSQYIRKLNDDALRTAATSQELTAVFQALLAPGLAAKMSMDEIRQLTVVGTNAVKSMGLDATQVVQELRDLVAGGITPASSTLATALGLKDSDIAAAKASSEGLFNFLMERMRGFEASSAVFNETIKGRLDSIQEGATRVAAEGFSPLIAAAKEALGEVSQVFVEIDKASGSVKLNENLVANLRSASQMALTAGQAMQSAAGMVYEYRGALLTLGQAYALIKFGSFAASIAQATQAKIEGAQASRLAAAQAAAEAAGNTQVAATSRQKVAAYLAELQAQVQLRQAELLRTQGFGSTATAANNLAQAQQRLDAAQKAASVSARAFGGVVGMLGGPVGVAITALTALAAAFFSAQRAAEQAALVKLSVDRAAAGKAENEDIARIRGELSQLKEQRDELLVERKTGIFAGIFSDRQIGIASELKQKEADIQRLDAVLKTAEQTAQSAADAAGNGLTLTVEGARQAFNKTLEGVNTKSSILDDFNKKLQASRDAYKALVATGADESALADARARMAEYESALTTERDKALKNLTAGTAQAGAAMAQANKLAVEDVQRSAAAMLGSYEDADAVLSAMRSAGLIGEQEYYQTKIGYLQDEAKIRIQALKDENALLASQAQGKAKSLEAERQIAKNRAEIARIEQQTLTKTTVLTVEAAAKRNQEAQAVEEQVAKLREEVQAREMATAGNISQAQALEQLRLARLAEALAQAKSRGASAEEIAAIEREIAARKELLQVMDGDAARLANAKAAEEAAKDWERTSKTIGDTLADYIMGGGKNAAQYLKRLFSTLVLQPVVQTVVGGIMGTLGFSGPAQAGSGLMGNLNNLGSLYNTYKNAPGWYNTATSWLGLGGGNAAGGLSASMAGGFWGSGAAGAAGGAAGGSGLGLSLGSSGIGMTAPSGAFGSVGAGAAGGAGGAGFGAAALKAVPYVAGAVAIAAALGAFRKTKVVDTGIMGTLGVEGGVHDFVQKRKSGSLFSGPKYTLEDAGVSSFDKPMQDAFKTMRQVAIDMGNSLGLATDHLKGFTTVLNLDSADSKSGTRGLNLKGLSDAEVQAKIEQALSQANNEMAQQLIGSLEEVTTLVKGKTIGPFRISASKEVTTSIYTPSEFAREGETAIETLTRLASSLGTVNPALKDLNLKLYAASLAGADMAYKLSELFGGMEGFTTATSSFYENFFTEEEQRRKLQAKLQDAFKEAKLPLPDIDSSNAREQYRKLAEAQDLTTESGRAAWATIMQLAEAFASITPSIDEARRALEEQAKALNARALAVQDLYRTPEQRQAAQYDNIASGLIGAGLSSMKQPDLSALLMQSSKDEIYAMGVEMWRLGNLSIEAKNALLDAAEALAALKDATQQQREGLLSTLWQMTGNTQALREKELAAIDPANRALQQLIYSLGDLQNAAQEAAQNVQQAWSGWGTAANLNAQYNGDSSGLAARKTILEAQISSSTDPAKRLELLQELISTEQALAQHAQKAQQQQAKAIQERQNALQAELQSARALADAAKRLGDYARDLMSGSASGLADSDRMAALAAEYTSLKSAARAGNVDAFGRLQSVTGDYLGLASTVAANGSEYSITAGRMAAELEALAKAQELVAQSQITGHEAQMQALQQQTDLLLQDVELSDSTKALIAKSALEQREVWEQESLRAEALTLLQERANQAIIDLPVGIQKTLSPLAEQISSTIQSSASFVANHVSNTLSSALAALKPKNDPPAKKDEAIDGSHAGGLAWVPFDGYRAELHRGERVLTAAQNRDLARLPITLPVPMQASADGGADVVAQLRTLQVQMAQLLQRITAIDTSTGQLAQQFDNVTAGGNAMATEVMA